MTEEYIWSRSNTELFTAFPFKKDICYLTLITDRNPPVIKVKGQ
jgi:hypothetical protein